MGREPDPNVVAEAAQDRRCVLDNAGGEKGSSLQPQTVIGVPAVPDAATSRLALAKSGAVHEPLDVGAAVYGQYRRKPGTPGGRSWHAGSAMFEPP